MASKYQKRPFNPEKLGKMRALIVETPDGNIVEIDYTDLKRTVAFGQFCFIYEGEGEDGDLIMPIIRKRTIDRLWTEAK